MPLSGPGESRIMQSVSKRALAGVGDSGDAVSRIWRRAGCSLPEGSTGLPLGCPDGCKGKLVGSWRIRKSAIAEWQRGRQRPPLPMRAGTRRSEYSFHTRPSSSRPASFSCTPPHRSLGARPPKVPAGHRAGHLDASRLADGRSVAATRRASTPRDSAEGDRAGWHGIHELLVQSRP